MHRLSLTSSALIFTSLASAALAQPQFGPGPDRPGGPARHGPESPIIKALDTNADGIISKEEIGKAAVALVTLDKNQDGKLTPDEFHPPHRGGPPPHEMFAKLMRCDANKDQQVSRDEIPQELTGFFQFVDANRDELLTSEEIRRAEERSRRDWQGQSKFRGSPDGMVGFIMNEHDANRDGKLAGREIPGRLNEKMGMIDSNKDGEIDSAELQQLTRFLQSRGGHRGPPRKGPPKKDGPKIERLEKD